MTSWNEVKYDDDSRAMDAHYTPKRYRVFMAPILAILFACVAIMTIWSNTFVGVDSVGVKFDTLSILLSLGFFADSIYEFICPSRYKIALAFIIIFSVMPIIFYLKMLYSV